MIIQDLDLSRRWKKTITLFLKLTEKLSLNRSKRRTEAPPKSTILMCHPMTKKNSKKFKRLMRPSQIPKKEPLMIDWSQRRLSILADGIAPLNR